jgi:hypothetical protein
MDAILIKRWLIYEIYFFLILLAWFYSIWIKMICYFHFEMICGSIIIYFFPLLFIRIKDYDRKKGLDLISNPLLTKEDRILKDLYEEKNIKKWSEIARIMESEHQIKGRNGKQCRERYHNHLDNSIKH